MLSRSLRLAVTGTALLNLLPISAAIAQTPSGEAAWHRFSNSQAQQWSVRWSTKGDRVERLLGKSDSYPGTPRQAAKAFMTDNADLLGLTGRTNDLQVVSQRQSLAGNHIRYQQVVGGMRVFNGYVDVHLNRSNQVALVQMALPSNDSLDAKLSSPSSMSARDATSVAMSAHGTSKALLDKRGRPVAPRAAAPSAAELGIYRIQEDALLAYRLTVGSVTYIIDANNGKVLKTRSMRQSVKGSGRVFDPNPIATRNNDKLKDEGDTNPPKFAPAYSIQDLPGIQKSGTYPNFQYRLIGPYVNTQHIDFSTAGCAADGVEVLAPPPVKSTPNFLLTRNKTGFEHTMVYRHIERNQRYIQSLGFTDLLNSPIRVDAHAFTADNSFYCADVTGAGFLAFGRGGVDDAEDADIILHEYGHALQDAASLGRFLGGDQAGAMGEGFSDYWAYNARPNITGGWASCIGEWDGEGKCLRRVTRDWRFPGHDIGSIHRRGQIWSRGLRDLRAELGPTKANRLILQSHYLIAENPTYVSGLIAILDADALLYDGAHRIDICAVFLPRGIGTSACGYQIRMSWPTLGADVDLRLRHPNGVDEPGYSHADDTSYSNRTPDWGIIGDTSDDPILYRDCITSCTDEVITVARLPTPGTYRVMAHYFNDHDKGPVRVQMDVFRGAVRMFSSSRTLNNTSGGPSGGDVWFAYDIIISANDALPQFVPNDQVMPASADPVLMRHIQKNKKSKQ